MRRVLIFLAWWAVTCGILFGVEVIGYRCTRLNILTEYNNTLYHKDTIVFFLDSEDAFAADLSKIYEYSNFDKCIILKFEYDEYEKNGIVFWGKDALKFADIEENPPIDIDYAIVGAKSGYMPGSTVEYQDKDYRVEYVLEEHINSLVNIAIFAYENNLNCIPMDSAYALTSSDRKIIKKAYDDLEKLVVSQNISIRCIEIDPTRYEDFIRFRNLYDVLMALFILFLIFVCYIHRLIWVKTRNKLNRILLVLGAADIIRRDVLSYMGTIILSCVCSAFMYLSIYGHVDIGRGFLVLILSGVILFFLGLSFVIPCIKSNRSD